jgi:catechol 2,3-dioxygenase-like lactoylglutathione lyase family enzyme
MLHVADVARSIRFYEALGFELIDVEGDPSCPAWARVHCEGGALMFLLAEEPIDPRAQSILLYLYAEDLPALREHLVARGLTPAPIERPEHMPSGEMRVDDPDGYVVLVGQWSESEHAPWEASRKERVAIFRERKA